MSTQPLGDRDATTAPIPDSTPRQIGYGHPEYQFVQGLMEMQKSLGEIHASIQHLRSDINRMGTKIDDVSAKVADLVKWKHMILGGALTIGFLLGIAVLALKLLGG